VEKQDKIKYFYEPKTYKYNDNNHCTHTLQRSNKIQHKNIQYLIQNYFNHNEVIFQYELIIFLMIYVVFLYYIPHTPSFQVQFHKSFIFLHSDCFFIH